MSDILEPPSLKNRVRSFVDLRRFANKVQESGIETAEGQDAFLASRRFVVPPAGPVKAGAILLSEGKGAVESQPVDEFVIVATGSVRFAQGGQNVTLGAGQSMVLPKGGSFTWQADQPACLIFMSVDGPARDENRLTPIVEAPQLGHSDLRMAELLIGPMPKCRNHTDFRSANGEFTCGTWDATPFHRRPIFYHHCELMYLLQGGVTLVDEAGRSGAFAKGDIFLVEQQAQCSWESREDVTKVYAIYRPV